MLYLVSFWDINKRSQLFRSSIRRVLIRDRMNKKLHFVEMQAPVCILIRRRGKSVSLFYAFNEKDYLILGCQ